MVIPAIAKFVNTMGETRFGIVTEAEESGMLHVTWDEFSELLKRLAGGGRASEADYRMLGVTQGWIRPEAQHANAKLDLLPIETTVNWTDPQMVKLHKQAQAGAKPSQIKPTSATQESKTPQVENVFRGQAVE